MYFRPSCSYFIDQNKMSSLVYTLVIPMLNPGTYDLQTKDVKEDVEKLRNKKWLHWKSIYLHACVYMCVHIYTHMYTYIHTYMYIYPNITYTMFQKWKFWIHLAWTNNYLYDVSPHQNVSFPNYSMLSFIPSRYLCYSLFVEILWTSTYQIFIALIFYLCINLIFYNLLRVSKVSLAVLCAFYSPATPAAFLLRNLIIWWKWQILINDHSNYL